MPHSFPIRRSSDLKPTASAWIRRISRSLSGLNPQKPWKVGFGGDVTVYDLRYAIAHEAGHAIGLDHPSPSGQLMSFRYDELFRDLQPGDVAGVVALYGPRHAATTSVRPSPRSEEHTSELQSLIRISYAV